MAGVTTRRNQFFGIALGLAVTVGTAVVLLTQANGLERSLLDKRFRYANPIPNDPRIVHVDIDDNAIDRIGRWPWNRDLLADMVRTLNDLGASAIALDLILDSSQVVRASELPQARLGTTQPSDMLGQFNEENLIYPDDELADAIRRGGNVYLSSHFDLRPREDALPTWAALLRDVEHTPAMDERAVARTYHMDAESARRALRTAQVTALLRKDFGLDEPEAAKRLSWPQADVAEVFAGAKRRVAALLAEAYLREQPDGDYAGLHARCLPGTDSTAMTADTKDLAEALAVQRGLHTMQAKLGPVPDELREQVGIAADVIAPLEKLGRAAAEVGFVVYRRDPDGKVRQMPVAAEFDGRLLRQLGFAVACRAMGLEVGSARMESDGYLVLKARDRRVLRVQLDELGEMVVPWTRTGRFWRANRDFPHITAAKVLTIPLNARLIRDNERRISVAMGDLIAATKKRYAGAYVERVEELLRLRREQRRDQLAGREREAAAVQRDAQIAKHEKQLADDNAASESLVRSTFDEMKDLRPESPEEEASFAAYRKAHATLTERIEPLRAANEHLRARMDAAKKELAALLRDKLVFVGYTATAEGDIVPAPIDASLPGVIVHSNVTNAFLTGQFIERPQRSTEIVVILLLGTIVSILTATRGPITALLVTLAIGAAYFLVNFFVLFRVLHLWVALAAPLGAMVVPWAAVTTYRQLTAERQKRFVQAQLAEFTSPALARRIAEDPLAAQALQRVENREVTCFFSDLAGFTTIAEQADSERVQQVLNTYLDRMSEVLFRHEAFLNKFLGDGIMAFFNPNVNPQPNHAHLACEASLESFEALERLKKELGATDDLYSRLSMRIGIASGIGGVGRFGSHRKADYTVIGDVANLAARLEPANKVFRTGLLVSGTTRDAVRDLYEWRYLAELQVKGKQLTVPVFELICRKGQLDEAQQEYVRRFEAAVELYKQRRWDEAIVQFTRLLVRRPDDVGASAYIDACQEKKLFPPDENWRGALELKEK